ncbi:MAG: uncharacterized protein QG604_570 [Candidatus Dependentiae bacterium]|nr:uncharacterized protein [Candidatus Dependentiae bacterium]
MTKKIAAVLAAGVAGLLVFLVIIFMMLRLTLGHSSGNQERRAKIRDYVCRVYGGKEVTFQASDGVTLAGLLIKRPEAKGTLILCHGYRHSKELMARYLGMFKEYNTLLFDFRGFGQSGGFFSSIGYYESNDVRAAIAYARKVIPLASLRPLVVLGVSMGAAAALKAAAETSVGIDGLILDSPYATLSEIINEAAGQFSLIPRPLIRFSSWFLQKILGPILDMNPEKYIAHISVPILFIHAATDSTTSPSHSIRLFRKMKQHGRAEAWLWLTPPAKHAYCYISYPQHYAMRVHGFLASL